MKRFLGFGKHLGSGLRWRPSRGQVAAALSLLALAMFCYVAGAFAMYFELPSSGFLGKAFHGAEVWFTRAAPPPQGPVDGEPVQAEVNIDRPEETYDGFTLYTTTHSPEATLIDMRGRVVHRWKMASRRAWLRAATVPDPPAGEVIHWEKCHLYVNGDLLALCCGGTGPYGYGLAKFDKDSNLLWGYSASLHHDLDVGEDGRIYVLGHKAGVESPAGVGLLPDHYIAESLIVLSPEGRPLDSIPLLEAFRDSPYRLTLLSQPGLSRGPFPPFGPQPGMPFIPPGLPQPGGPAPQPGGPPPQPRGPAQPTGGSDPSDIFHTNSVRVLSRALAPKFPLFKAGQVLISLRTPNVLAVLDTEKRSVVWAAKGVWGAQHDAQFLSNGHLLCFDNFGSPGEGARVLEYNPHTQALPWSYTSVKATPITSVTRGGNQRLPNGNTLIVNSEGRRFVEVTRGKQVVWQWCCPSAPAPQGRPSTAEPLNFTGGRRYGPTELTFLKGDPHVQPR